MEKVIKLNIARYKANVLSEEGKDFLIDLLLENYIEVL